MMKKLLALLAVVAMLCVVTGMGAHAATPKEEARALVEETLRILQSRRYTYSSTHCRINVVNGNQAVEEFRGIYNYRDYYPSLNNILYNQLMRLHYGSVESVIHMPGRTVHFYPERGFYYEEPRENEPYVPELFEFWSIEKLQKADMNSLTAERVTKDDIQYLKAAVTADGVDFYLYYLEGKLARIEFTHAESDHFSQQIDMWVSLEPTVDESLFKFRGIKAPERLLPDYEWIHDWARYINIYANTEDLKAIPAILAAYGKSLICPKEIDAIYHGIYFGDSGPDMYHEYKIDLKNKQLWEYRSWNNNDNFGTPRNPAAVNEGFNFVRNLEGGKVKAFRRQAKWYGLAVWEGDYPARSGQIHVEEGWKITIVYSDGTTQISRGDVSVTLLPLTWDKMYDAFEVLTGEDIFCYKRWHFYRH